jgi:HAMP domain-containing protein
MRTTRKRYLVRLGAQLRYMSLAAVPLIFLSAGLYYLIYYSVFSEMLIPEAVVATLLPAMRKVNVVVAIAAPVALYLVIRAALIYSNRLVGPLPRIERELDRAIAGDPSIRLKVRDNDELRGLVSRVNLLLEKAKIIKTE